MWKALGLIHHSRKNREKQKQENLLWGKEKKGLKERVFEWVYIPIIMNETLEGQV
jgi:hypothetical protein